jgi:hypothetical protein
VRSLRRLAIRDAFAALAAAWRLAFEPASPVATSARASAAALFLSVVILVGVGGAVFTSGALTLLGPDGAAPQQLAPAAAPTESSVVAIESTPSPEPTPTAEPTPTPVPTPIPAPPIFEGDRSDGEDGPVRETPEPEEKRETPEPKERKTPEPSEKRETPEPKERERDERDQDDDHKEDD